MRQIRLPCFKEWDSWDSSLLLGYEKVLKTVTSGFGRINESGQLPLLCVEESSRIIRIIKNISDRTGRYQWLYGSFCLLQEDSAYSCYSRAREAVILSYSGILKNTVQGALICCAPAGINGNYSPVMVILKVQELVF